MALPIMSVLGPIGTAFSLSSGVYNLIKNHDAAEATLAYRTEVEQQLTLLQKVLDSVDAELKTLSAQVAWDELVTAAGLTTADGHIDNLWEAVGMDAYLQGTSPVKTDVFIAATSKADTDALPDALNSYDRAIRLGQTSPSNSLNPDTFLIPSYVEYLQARLALAPGQAVSTSLCEMAYAYWAKVVRQECRAYLMYGLACIAHKDIYQISDLTSGWYWDGSQPYDQTIPYLQGLKVQAQITQIVQAQGYDAFCSVPVPIYYNTGSPLPISRVSYAGMYHHLLDAQSELPAGHVLVSWRLSGLYAGYPNNIGNIYYSLFHGIPDASGVVAAANITETKVSTGDYLDPSMLRVYEADGMDGGNAPSNDTAETRVICANSNPSAAGAWWIHNINSQTSAMPNTAAALTGLTFAYSASGNTTIRSYQSQLVPGFGRTSSYQTVAVNNPGTGYVFGLQAQYAVVENGVLSSDACQVITPAFTENLGTMVFDASQDAVTSDVHRAEWITRGAVGADYSENFDLDTIASRFTNPMTPMTGVGLGYYPYGSTNVAVIRPVNYYAFHLNSFASPVLTAN